MCMCMSMSMSMSMSYTRISQHSVAICPQPCTQMGLYQLPSSSHSSIPSIMNCYLCEKTFADSYILTNHIRSQHGEEILELPHNSTSDIHCKFCSKTFQSMIHLNRHTHTEHSNTVNAVEVHQTADNQPHGVGLTEIHTANYHTSNPDQYFPEII